MLNTKVTLLFKVTLVAFLSLFTSIAFASSNNTCSHLFSDSKTQSIKNYFKEVKENFSGRDGDIRGSRLFLVNPQENVQTTEGRISKLLPGFFIYENIPAKTPGLFKKINDYFRFTVPHKFGYWFTGQKNVRFAPLKWFDRNFLDKPVQAVTQEILYKRKSPSALVKFAFYFMMYAGAYNQFDTLYWKALDSKIENQIVQKVDESPQDFLKLVQTDYRFEPYKKGLVNSDGSINKQNLYDAAAFSRLIVEYYKVRDSKKEELSLADEKQFFENNPLFAGVREFTNANLKPSQNFDVSPKNFGPLSESQQNRIYKLRHLLLLNYQILDMEIFNPEAMSYYKSQSHKVTAIENLLNDSFVNAVIDLKTQGKISAVQSKYVLQKYLNQLYLLGVFETMGIQYYMDKSHQTPYTLESVRTALAQDIQDSN